MAKKKIIKTKKVEEVVKGKKAVKETPIDEETMVGGEEGAIDPAIIEDTFTEEFSEYNDVDNF